MNSAELLESAVDVEVRRFAVAWRDPATGRTRRIGVLDYDGVKFRFTYLPPLGPVAGFKTLVGFPDVKATYESARLWPFFDLRVMDSKRPDFAEYVGWLGLGRQANRLDILARSGGERKGDTVSLTESPQVDPSGRTKAVVLVRGASYATRHFDSAAYATRLEPGASLQILDDLTNEANPRALLLATPSGTPIGWVPDLLIDYARELRAGDGSVTVLQNNGPDSPWHVRLLIRLSGQIDLRSRPFWGAEWDLSTTAADT